MYHQNTVIQALQIFIQQKQTKSWMESWPQQNLIQLPLPSDIVKQSFGISFSYWFAEIQFQLVSIRRFCFNFPSKLYCQLDEEMPVEQRVEAIITFKFPINFSSNSCVLVSVSYDPNFYLIKAEEELNENLNAVNWALRQDSWSGNDRKKGKCQQIL